MRNAEQKQAIIDLRFSNKAKEYRLNAIAKIISSDTDGEIILFTTPHNSADRYEELSEGDKLQVDCWCLASVIKRLAKDGGIERGRKIIRELYAEAHSQEKKSGKIMVGYNYQPSKAAMKGGDTR
ncbi:MAG: hypothetical protein IJ662_06440 [Clostridia bacterium]|nr:hypothetical protein [Clostridia bacterium]